MRQSHESTGTEAETNGPPFRFTLSEVSGSLADLGTLLPLAIAVIAIGNLPASGVLLSFGAFYVATGFYYRLPIPVQPMKAVAAVAIATGATAADMTATGLMLGAILLLLGLTGWIGRLARLVPQSITAGLQVGLGLMLAMTAVQLMSTAWLGGTLVLILMAVLLFHGKWPAAIAGLAAAVILAPLTGMAGIVGVGGAYNFGGAQWSPVMPDAGTFIDAATRMVLPQFALTFTNAIVLTSLLASDYFGKAASRATPDRLAITSGLANLIAAPLGGMAMCHGAGGLAAHYRFGARTGAAPVIAGALLIACGLMPASALLLTLKALPAAGLGALLLIASWEMAASRRLLDARPSCWPVIAVTAIVTVLLDPFVGLIAGTVCEVLRKLVLSLLSGKPKAS